MTIVAAIQDLAGKDTGFTNAFDGPPDSALRALAGRWASRFDYPSGIAVLIDTEKLEIICRLKVEVDEKTGKVMELDFI